MLILLGAFALAERPGDVAVVKATPFVKPPAVASNEADADQLGLARDQGQAEAAAIDWIRGHATLGGEAQAGEFRIVWVLIPPEGDYELRGTDLQWHPPHLASAHLRVFVLDGADGRLVPDLVVRATLHDGAQAEVAQYSLPYGRYPLADAYGENVRLPAGDYSLTLSIAPYAGRRHDPKNGQRFTQPVTADFAKFAFDPKAWAGKPPLSEAEAAQAGLARAIGESYGRALRALAKEAHDLKDRRDGAWDVAVAEEDAEGWWAPQANRQLRFTFGPGHPNAHLEVLPRDAKTGRFVPSLAVSVRLIPEHGRPVGAKAEPFMWHPWLYHYGENWRVPRSGLYRVKVHLDPPSYPLYGRSLGPDLAHSVDLEFDDVRVETGRKKG